MSTGAFPVLALGDSYTIGEGVAPDGRWPAQLARALRESGIPAGEPRIVAQTGWTTEELDAAIDAADPQGPFELVTLLIGVNDQYRGHEVDGYRARYDALLLRAIGFAGGRAGRVLALSIPDWGVTPFGQASGRDPAAIARDIDAYNATAGERCATHGTGWVDVAPVSRARGAHPSMLAEDGLHPSAAMYAEWTALALPEARRLLGAEPGSESTFASRKVDSDPGFGSA